MPPDAAHHVLSDLLPLVPLHAEFGRHMMMLLRKTLVAPDHRARALAVHGFCTILKMDLLAEDPSAQADVVLALRSACALSPSLQARTYLRLREPLTAGAPRSAEAMGLLFGMLVEPLHYFALQANSDPNERGGSGSTNGVGDRSMGNAATTKGVANIVPRGWTRALDATWAAWLVGAVWHDERGAAAVVLPPLFMLLVRVASAPAPPGCFAHHGQIATALAMLRKAMRPEAIFLATRGSNSEGTASQSAKGSIPPMPVPAAPAAEVAKRAVGRLHALTRVAIALTDWTEDDRGGGNTRGASSRGNSSGGGSGSLAISHLSATSGGGMADTVAAAVEMVRGALLAADSTTGARSAFPVSAACTRALESISATASLAATSGEAASQQLKDAGVPAGVAGSGGGVTAAEEAASPPLDAFFATLQHFERAVRTEAAKASSGLAASALLSCHALSGVASYLARHEAAAAQRALFADLHGGEASPPAAGEAAGHSSSAPNGGGASGGNGSSSGGGGGSGSSSMSDGSSGGAAESDGYLPKARILQTLSALLRLLSAARAWENRARNQSRAAASRRGGGGKRARGQEDELEYRARLESHHETSAAQEGDLNGDGLGLGRSDDAADGKTRSVDGKGGERAADVLQFSPVEQEECSLLIRTASLGLIRQILSHQLVVAEAVAEAEAPSSGRVAGAYDESGEEDEKDDRQSNVLVNGAAVANEVGDAREGAAALQPRHIFGRLLSDFSEDVRVGVPVPLLLTYVALFDELVGQCGGAAADRAARAARSVLADFSVEHVGALRALLKLMLSHTRGVGPSAEAAADACLAAIGMPRTASSGGVHPADDAADESSKLREASPSSMAAEWGRGGQDSDEGSDGDIRKGGGCGSDALTSAAKSLHEPSTARQMKLCASVQTRIASIQAAIAHWRSQVGSCSPSDHATFSALVPPIARALLPLFEGRPATGAAPSKQAQEAVCALAVTTRTLGLMTSVLTLAAKAAAALRGRSNHGGADHGGGELSAWLPVWQSLAPLLRGFSSWLRTQGSTWSAACRRRVPTALYLCDRTTLAVIGSLEAAAERAAVAATTRGRLGSSQGAAETEACTDLLRELRRDWTAAGRASGGGKKRAAAPRGGSALTAAGAATNSEGGGGSGDEPEEEGDGEVEEKEDEVVVEEEGEELRPGRGASRRRLRSRNPYIDAELGQGYGDDSFADLEDFIVCKRGRVY